MIPDLLTRTAELVDIASVSHDEAAITDHIAAIFGNFDGFAIDRVGANLVARTNLGCGQRLALAGHTDTVPVNDNADARREGDTVYGLGSADMKSGLAVFVELAAAISRGDLAPTCDLTFVFYACEEVAREHNGLLELFASRPDLTECDAAILGEPTDAWIEAGCQGAFSVELGFAGARAHSARPWTGVNAIHRAGIAIERVRLWPGRQPVIDECEYREAMQVVMVSGGVARNVVPDACTITINHRFAPDHDLDAARAAVRAVVGDAFHEAGGDTWNEIDVSAAAPPSLGHPLLAKLVERSGRAPRAKLGWTDVAFFAEQSIPAANFGPGDPLLAHTQGEFVTRTQLEAAWNTLVGVVTA
ncbi:MAG TPA: succinyl-diaminopimelate desuccinylase [Acidimicrobiales bacterium]|nr:succinyl-diaminopimelate desuccinylase [Acidimicrobiales bacterium]